MKQGLLILLGMIFLTGAILFAAVTFSDLKKKEIENLARFQCAESSRYTITGKDGAVVWYPVEDLYQKCLDEKHLQ
jgi:hypothetical protein